MKCQVKKYSGLVALRKESVDRNVNPGSTELTFPGSLSARRAWIEIKSGLQPLMASLVALRKESVDRNMPGENLVNSIRLVALRKESVDRNGLSCADKVSH